MRRVKNFRKCSALKKINGARGTSGFSFLIDLFSLTPREKRSGQNAVQFMIITVVILTVVGIVAISAGSEFEKTLSLASVKNTANAFAVENDLLVKNIETQSGNGYYNFTLNIENKEPPVDLSALKEKALEKIAVILNQPAPVIEQVDDKDCSRIAHFTYCVKV